MIRADLKAARTAWLNETPEGSKARAEREKSDSLEYRDAAGRVFDFHALRHQFASALAAADVHPKTAQELMRHSTINLTMNVYTHMRRSDLSGALDALPNLSRPRRERAQSTGTDGEAAASMSPCTSSPGAESGAIHTPGCAFEPPPRNTETPEKSGVFMGSDRLGRAGVEPATHGFSVHCSTN